MGFIKNFSFTLGTQIITLALSIINSIIIVRMLGAEGQGIFTLVITTSSMLAIFLGGGLQWSNTYWVAKDKKNIKNIFFNSIIFASGVGVLIIIAHYLGIYRFFARYMGKSIALISFIVVPFILLQQYNEATLQGLQNFNRYNLVILWRPLFIFLTFFIILVLLRMDVTAAANGWLAVIISTALFSIILVSGYIKKQGKYNIGFMWSSLKVGSRATLSNLVWFFLARVDMYMIAYFLSTKDVGYYSIAVLVVELLFIAPQIVGKLIFPKASARERDSHILAAKLNRISIFYSLVLAMVIAVTGKHIIVLLLGPDFIKSFYPLLFLLPGIVAINSSSTLGYYILGREGYPPIIISSVVFAFFINFFLNLILIPKFKIIGAGIASSIAYIIFFLLYSRYFCKLTKLSFTEFLIPKREDLNSFLQLVKVGLRS